MPDGKQITPYINATGHHAIHLQTFTTDTITLRATAPGHDGTLVRVTRGTPKAFCVPLGETRPRTRCPR